MTCSNQNKITQTNSQILTRKWMMVGYKSYSKEELINKNAFIDLSQGEQVTCFMGCNTINFNLLKPDESRLKFENGISTQKACEKMDLESSFLNDITKITNYQIEGHRLTLSGNENLKMEFIAQDWD